MPGHCRINGFVLQRSKRQSAIMQLGYQMCTYAADEWSHADYSRFASDHLGGVILLPEGANSRFADEGDFIMATCFREERKDAQEGRVITFSLPRELPDQLLLPVSAFAIAHFVEQGMAARLDVECPLASDGERHPHAHCYLAQRVLEEDGYGRKAREWNAQFRSSAGRDYRAIIGARITIACALLGIAAFADPRKNEEKGLGEPEERYSKKSWRMSEKGYVAEIEKLKTKRRERKSMETISLAPMPATGPLAIKSAVSSRPPMSDWKRNQCMNSVIQLVDEIGVDARGTGGANGEIELITPDGPVIFDGETFTIADSVGPLPARLVVKLAKQLGWPALVVEGNSKSADEIILAGISLGIIRFNTCASDHSLSLIKEKYGYWLAAVIDPLDPLSVVDTASLIETASILDPVSTLDFSIPETETIVDTAPSIVDWDVEDFPEAPKPSAGDEEQSRAEAAELAARFFARQEEGIQRYRLRGMRDNGGPPGENKTP